MARGVRFSQEAREQQLGELDRKSFVRWAEGEYRNQRSKAVMCCSVCRHEWAATVDNLLSGRGCPKCAKQYRYSALEREAQLNDLPSKRFVKWDGQYIDGSSKATMLCLVCSHVWSARASSLVLDKRGCPKCAGQYRYSPQERENQIDSLPNISFYRWVDAYMDSYSKAIVSCHNCTYLWAATVHDLLTHGTGCPACSKSGYKPSKPGTLYALRSWCGNHVKIGISNNYPRRMAELRRHTPFGFVSLATITCDDGAEIRNLELMFQSGFRSSGLVGFHGCTEWLHFDPAIIELMKMLGAEVPDELLSPPL